ncbi:UPF0175 family protein [Haloarcula sp. S1CR25-12]|uniref:UPF0175 family protein n=1 Tax=Haloarcula saliterrae TaxID=2950534 RepID=A0ABU2FIT5_9EURY|nr:UPF0175 family protein [Haloarcula sp. S1CR25-12]MDS0261620.1 UPF0175 family protein [Haloarcula sp. S1CR25-12]
MSHTTLNTALQLYRDGTFTLETASAQSDCSRAKLVAELQSHGISLRDEDKAALAERGAC